MKALFLVAAFFLLLGGQAEASAFGDLNAGIAAYNRGDLDETIRRLSLALAAPDLPAGYAAVANFDRGEAYARKEQWVMAIADFTACLKADPAYLDAYAVRGSVYMQTRQFDLAIADYGALVQARPFFVAGYVMRGSAYLSQERFEPAIADYADVIRIDPNATVGYSLRADAYRRINRFADAIADSNHALQIDSNSPSGYLERGLIYEDEGDFSHALDDFSQGLKLDQGNADARLRVGLAQWELGRFDDAAATFAQTVQARPTLAYSVLWRSLAKAMNAPGPDEELRQSAAKLDLGKWPGPIVNYFLGSATADQVMKAAAIGDADTQRNQICEGNFYLGAWQVTYKNENGAKPLLSAAASNCPHEFIERDAAIAELKRLP
jgi:lipoprotein NlpI